MCYRSAKNMSQERWKILKIAINHVNELNLSYYVDNYEEYVPEKFLMAMTLNHFDQLNKLTNVDHSKSTAEYVLGKVHCENSFVMF